MVDVSDGTGTAAGARATGTDAGAGSAAATEESAVVGGSGASDMAVGGSAEASGQAASVSSMTGDLSSTRLLLAPLAVASSDALALALLAAAGAFLAGVMATRGRLLRHKLLRVMKPSSQNLLRKRQRTMAFRTGLHILPLKVITDADAHGQSNKMAMLMRRGAAWKGNG